MKPNDFMINPEQSAQQTGEAQPSPIVIPDDVRALIDEAHSGFAISFVEGAAQLLSESDKTVVKEVKWADAGQFGRNLLNNALKRHG